MKLLDILLFPEGFYRRLTDKRPGLYAGMVFVGAVDLAFTLLSQKFMKYFTGIPGNVLAANLILIPVTILLLGILDVLCFTLPLSDLFGLFKRNEPAFAGESVRIRLMKTYISAHFLIVPANALLLILMNYAGTKAYMTPGLVDTYTLVITVWFSAIILRGANTIYRFEPVFKGLAFAGIYAWNVLISYAFVMINYMVLKLFRAG